MAISLIVAAAENNAIGKDNALLWHLSADLKRFKALTTGHPVIMGRKTFESIGKPLPNRRNIVISHSRSVIEGCEVVASVDDALASVEAGEEAFVIGGGSIYRALWHVADRLYLTSVKTTLEGDTFIPEINPEEWKEVSREDFEADGKNEFGYSFIDYVRVS